MRSGIQVQRAQKAGELCVQEGEVTAVVPTPDGAIEVRCLDGRLLWADHILLATGFDLALPGGEWLETAVVHERLPVAACGYPILDKTLCWAPGVYVSGALAELEMGPIAANIAGARQAARRLTAAVSQT